MNFSKITNLNFTSSIEKKTLYRHTSRILQVRFPTTAIKRVVTFFHLQFVKNTTSVKRNIVSRNKTRYTVYHIKFFNKNGSAEHFKLHSALKAVPVWRGATAPVQNKSCSKTERGGKLSSLERGRRTETSVSCEMAISGTLYISLPTLSLCIYNCTCFRVDHDTQ